MGLRIAHVDCSSGATGHMWLGALLDAGASIETLQRAVDTLGVGNVRIAWARVRRAGEAACAVRVRAPEETPHVATWTQVRNILEFTALDATVRDRAVKVFKRLAEADARVRDVHPADVDFHEVLALDMLADVVGTCAAIQELGIERLTVGPIATGTGTRTSTLGAVELPEPAVRDLLSSHALDGQIGRDVELVDVVGAALIAEFCESVEVAPAMRLERTGTGAGSVDLATPNVLRIHIGVTEE